VTREQKGLQVLTQAKGTSQINEKCHNHVYDFINILRNIQINSKYIEYIVIH